jgi:hypothetical protein
MIFFFMPATSACACFVSRPHNLTLIFSVWLHMTRLSYTDIETKLAEFRFISHMFELLNYARSQAMKI